MVDEYSNAEAFIQELKQEDNGDLIEWRLNLNDRDKKSESRPLYRPPAIDDFRHAKLLNMNRRLSPLFDPFIDQMAERVRLRAGKNNRSDLHRNLRTALGVIIWNLFQSHLTDENRYVIIKLRNKGYRAGPYNPLKLGIRSIHSCLEYLSNERPRYISYRGGNFDINIGRGYTTRCRAEDRLISELQDYLESVDLNSIVPKGINPKGIIGNILRENPQSPLTSTLFKQEPLPSIRLRGVKPDDGGSAAFCTFRPTEDTIRMEANLAAYNRFLSDHWIDLLLSNEEFDALSRRIDNARDAFGDKDDQRWCLDILSRNSLYRVFNNGSFGDGGRFYGGWWQGVPRDLRRHLTINGFPTAELDYSNMQVAMLYAKQGLELEGDAYQIEGIPKTHRKLIKRTVFKIINADGRIRAPRRDELPEGWTWPQIMDAVREKHRPIARYFGTGEGLRLQRRDADIAEAVMLRMMGEGRLVLPIHDSFVVEEGHQNQLRDVMVETYRQHLGFAINVDANPTWLEELPAEAMELHQEGVRYLSDWWTDEEWRPGYENYRSRKTAFLEQKGEYWGHTHRFFH